jgi:hypothetical protein
MKKPKTPVNSPDRSSRAIVGKNVVCKTAQLGIHHARETAMYSIRLRHVLFHRGWHDSEASRHASRGRLIARVGIRFSSWWPSSERNDPRTVSAAIQPWLGYQYYDLGSCSDTEACDIRPVEYLLDWNLGKLAGIVVSSAQPRPHMAGLVLRSRTRTSRLNRICWELTDGMHSVSIATVLLWSPLIYLSMPLRNLCCVPERATRFSILGGNRKYVRIELTLVLLSTLTAYSAVCNAYYFYCR